jgi:hypothetical protein
MASWKETRLAELRAIERLLDSFPDGRMRVERISLNARREELAAEIEAGPPDHDRAGMTVSFTGRPVLGTRGIRGAFAGAAIGYVSMAVRHQARQLGESDGSLHLTSTPRGSFGFKLEQLGEQQLPIFDNLVATAIAQILEFLRLATTGDKDGFESAASVLHPYAVSSIQKLVREMVKAGAYASLDSGNISVELSTSNIKTADENVSKIRVDEHVEVLEGTFLGALPESRTFEFRTTDGDTLTGQVIESLDTHTLRSHEDKRCTAEIVRVVSTQGQRAGRERLVLLGLHDVGWSRSRRGLTKDERRKLHDR